MRNFAFYYHQKMLYPKSIEQKLGFDKVRELLKERCGSDLGRHFVDRMIFMHTAQQVSKLVGQVYEFQTLIVKGEAYSQQGFVDISEQLKKANIPGLFLQTEEMDAVKRSLTVIADAVAFFAKPNSDTLYPELYLLASPIEYDPRLLKDIDAVIDERGQIRNNASPELARIRQQIITKQNGLRGRLDDLLSKYKSQGYSKEDASPTIREGRLVLPIAAEHKRIVKGLVHDVSATGQTLFVEPQEVLDLNNEVRELILQERQEIIRILLKLTDKLRPHIPALEKANRFLGIMDFIRAKALFANEIGALRPQFEEGPVVYWRSVTHPLLLLSHRAQGKSVVAQNVELSAENRILVISGPNAGGKSIALKTIGLVQYMWQCGLLVPMLENSRMGIFKSIFIDIGDEQSLEDDLSTYSSHLTNMKQFLRNADRQSLCLIDEFGTGTEPKLGASIAEAILEQLNKQQVYGVITTHYDNLKFFADRTQGLVNGAMRYNIEEFRPLYELEIGQPGTSFALEIAEKIGLPKHIVEGARRRVGVKQVSVDRLLGQLEVEKRELEERNAEMAKKQQELEKLLAEYNEKKDDLERNRRKMLNDAKAEAKQIMSRANQKIEMAVRSIKELQADPVVTKQIRHEVERFKETLEPEPLPAETTPEKDAPYEIVGGSIAVGDFVKIKDQEAIGEVVAIGPKDATVMMGELKSNIKLNRLTKVSRKEVKKQQKAFAVERRIGIDMTEKMSHFSPHIDIRGMRAEEVLAMLEDFMDNALLFNQRSLRIVHGKGTGALREVVRSFLRRRKEVSSLSDEHADRGGDGVTLVELD
jgi:DNA mismatch repair protein MutS2